VESDSLEERGVRKMAAKNNKNKRRKPIKQHAGKKQRETAYDRLDRQIDELMFDVAMSLAT
jgi:hypothetical protein